jgi:hypothetical protein
MFTSFLNNLTIYGGLLALDQGLSVVYTAGGLSSACVEGVFEAGDNIFKYGDFLKTPMILYYNLIYNFGLLYNSVKSMVYFFVFPDRNKITNTNDLGKQFGALFYNLFSS